jgi:putative transposase
MPGENPGCLLYNFLMPNFRRYYIPDALIFITCVTYNRIPYFEKPENLTLLWETMRSVQVVSPFHLLAYVILRDHLHLLMQMPPDQPDFSRVLHSLKRNYAINYKKAHEIHGPLQLWQARFWDHIIRDDCDLERHIDYIHWNPVRHGYVSDPGLWAQSTFLHWVKRGYYPSNWRMTTVSNAILWECGE